MRLPYRMEVRYDEDHWAARFPELPGLVAGAETWEELPAKVEDAKRTWFEAMLEDEMPIPEPLERQEYSGRILLRLPKGIHRDLIQEAEREGVSLNTLLNSILGRGLEVARQAGRTASPRRRSS
jgi:antitoxin HicB